jgi:hypothetical protein
MMPMEKELPFIRVLSPNHRCPALSAFLGLRSWATWFDDRYMKHAAILAISAAKRSLVYTSDSSLAG